MMYNVPNSTTGADEMLVGFAGGVSSFAPVLLFFIFVIIFIVGSGLQRRRTGYSDFSFWAILGMIAVLMVSLAMSLVQNMISPTTMIVVVILTLLCGVWFFFSRRQIEE